MPRYYLLLIMYRKLFLALTLLLIGLHLQAQQEDDKKMARLDSIASNLYAEGNYEEALNTLLRETNVLERTPDDKRYIEALAKIGLCYEKLDLPFKAIEVNKRAINLYTHIADEDAYVANRSNYIAGLYLAMDDKKMAEQWVNETLRISNKVKPSDGDRVKHLTTAAKTTFALGKYKEAINHQREIITIMGRHMNKHHEDYLELLSTLRGYYSGADDKERHDKVSEEIRQLKKEIETGVLPEPTDLSTPALCRRHNIEALLCSRWILNNYLSTKGMKEAADFIIQFRKRTPDAAVYLGPAELEWVKRYTGFYVAYIAASIEYALQHPDEQRYSVEQYKAAMYRLLDYYKENKSFAGEIKRFDTYLQLKEMAPAELEKRLEKNFKDFTEAMNSRKKGRISAEDPVLLNFSY